MNFFLNILIILSWHYISFKVVTRPSYKLFYEGEKDCDPKKLLKLERFYEKVLKIKIWKDKIPQYISRSGFSKRKIKSLDLNYLNRFICETYRAEADHFMCCLIMPFLFFLNKLESFIFFSILIMLGNIPCILIQRYNRCRLRRLIMKIQDRNERKMCTKGNYD